MLLQSEADWLLEKIVVAVNGADREIPISLLIGGVTVSGNLVSVHKYLDHIHDQIVFDEEGVKVDDINFQNEILSRLIKNSSEDSVLRKDSLDETALFIHIQDAKFHYRTSPKGVFWRGKIEQVDGFHLGV